MSLLDLLGRPPRRDRPEYCPHCGARGESLSPESSIRHCPTARTNCPVESFHLDGGRP